MLDWMIMPFKRYADFRPLAADGILVVRASDILIYVVLGTLMVLGGLDLAALSNPAAGGQMATPGPLFYVGAGLLGIWALAPSFR